MCQVLPIFVYNLVAMLLYNRRYFWYIPSLPDHAPLRLRIWRIFLACYSHGFIRYSCVLWFTPLRKLYTASKTNLKNTLFIALMIFQSKQTNLKTYSRWEHIQKDIDNWNVFELLAHHLSSKDAGENWIQLTLKIETTINYNE